MQLVDTNVLAYLLMEGDRTAAAQALYARDADWRSEAFLMVEFANLIATHVRARALGAEQSHALLAEAGTLMPALPSVDHDRALGAALEFGISAYDARFIALAMQMKTRLVTADARLRAAVPAWTTALGAAQD